MNKRVNTIIFALLCTHACSCLSANNPAIIASKVVVPSSTWREPRAIAQQNGRFLLAGRSEANSSIWVSEVSSNGETQWLYERAARPERRNENVSYVSVFPLGERIVACGSIPAEEKGSMSTKGVITILSNAGALLKERSVYPEDGREYKSTSIFGCKKTKDGFVAVGSATLEKTAMRPGERSRVGWITSFNTNVSPIGWRVLNNSEATIPTAFEIAPDGKLLVAHVNYLQQGATAQTVVTKYNASGDMLKAIAVPDEMTLVRPGDHDEAIYLVNSNSAEVPKVYSIDRHLENIHVDAIAPNAMAAEVAYSLPRGRLALFGRAITGYNESSTAFSMIDLEAKHSATQILRATRLIGIKAIERVENSNSFVVAWPGGSDDMRGDEAAGMSILTIEIK